MNEQEQPLTSWPVRSEPGPAFGLHYWGCDVTLSTEQAVLEKKGLKKHRETWSKQNNYMSEGVNQEIAFWFWETQKSLRERCHVLNENRNRKRGARENGARSQKCCRGGGRAASGQQREHPSLIVFVFLPSLSFPYSSTFLLLLMLCMLAGSRPLSSHVFNGYLPNHIFYCRKFQPHRIAWAEGALHS